MSKSIEKAKALDLRRAGESIKEIAKLLNISRSTASVWCQNVTLTKKQRANLLEKQITAGNVGRQKGAEVNRQKKVRALNEARKSAELQITQITTNQLLFLGLGLYWGEGIKSRSGPAAIVNSDPKILRTAIRWFTECLSVSLTEIRPYVYISNQHKHREKVIMKYWSDQLKIPIYQFKSPIFINQNSVQYYENKDTYFGVVAMRILKSSKLKYRILALIDEVSKKLE